MSDERVLQAIADLRVKVTDKLARIETNTENLSKDLDDHVEEDREQFKDLGKRLQEIEVDHRVAERAGARTGRKHALGVSAGLLAAIEILPRLWKALQEWLS